MISFRIPRFIKFYFVVEGKYEEGKIKLHHRKQNNTEDYIHYQSPLYLALRRKRG